MYLKKTAALQRVDRTRLGSSAEIPSSSMSDHTIKLSKPWPDSEKCGRQVPLNSHSVVKQEILDSEDPTASENPPAASAHPLYNHVILQGVFELLKVDDLKSCRQTCKLWDDLATPPMILKGAISINADDVESFENLKDWINSSPWCVGSSGDRRRFFKNYLCDKVTRLSYQNLGLILGPQVRSLTVSHWWNDHRDLKLCDYEHLLLSLCPNLEELNIPSTENFRYARNFLLCAITTNNTVSLRLKTLIVTGETMPSKKFWRIITISPQLVDLKLYCQLSDEFWNPFPIRRTWDQRMRNLKVIEVKSFGNESVTDDSGNYFLTRSWSLEKITCECYILSDTLLRVCYENIAQTLHTLNITFFNKHSHPWAVDKVNEGFLTDRLIKFKHWKLSLDDHCRGPLFARSLLTSISLPFLVSFRMTPYDDECHADWDNGLFGQMLDDTFAGAKEVPVRPDFRVLTLPPKFQDLSCIHRLITIYPNITELELDTPTPEVVSTVFAKWTKLERLRLTLSDDIEICWTSILSHPCTSATCPGAPLANLTGLASLEIALMSKAKRNHEDIFDLKHPLNDDLIYHELIKLPRIQNIVVNGHKFSPAAIYTLRRFVPIYCHIDVSNL